MKAGCQLSVVSCQKERAEREANGEEPTAKRRTARSELVSIRVGRRNEDFCGCWGATAEGRARLFIQWRVSGFREASLALRIRTSCSRTFAPLVPGLCFSSIGNSTRDRLPWKWLRYIGLVAWPLQWKATIG